jgi:hypothetical protein
MKKEEFFVVKQNFTSRSARGWMFINTESKMREF